MASEPKTTLLLKDLSELLTFKLLKNVEFLNYACTVKGIQCHSNHSPQLFELKKKSKQQITSLVI